MSVFELKKIEDGVRVGELETAHGVLKTPFFMPVGTQGSVKGVSSDELRSLGAQIVLSNTYHLYLRPGEQLIKKLGGLHEFMKWDGPILTDSGGYQVFSLGERKNKHEILNPKSETISNNSNPKQLQTTSYKLSKSLVKIVDDGVEFTSHLDGSKHLFTPEKVVQIQLDLGVDIIMPLDVCPSGKATREEIKRACDTTIDWAKRSKVYFDRKIQETRYKVQTIPNKPNIKRPLLFAIVQGGLDAELRKYCADELIKLDFDGYAVGGLAVDNETRDMWETVKLMGELLPEDKPRYLMGVGTPDDINRGIHLGMDMFDCVLPTRLGRHGSVFVHKHGNPKSETRNTKQISNEANSYKLTANSFVADYQPQYELVNLLKAENREDGGVIDEKCACAACRAQVSDSHSEIGRSSKRAKADTKGYSKAYLSHLIRSNEILGMRLCTMHNLYVYLSLVNEHNGYKYTTDQPINEYSIIKSRIDY